MTSRNGRRRLSIGGGRLSSGATLAQKSQLLTPGKSRRLSAVSIGSANSTGSRHVPADVLPLNDDAAEKAAIRNARRARQASISAASKAAKALSPSKPISKQELPNPAEASETAPPKLSGAMLGELYTRILKMSSEGKINAKNSWSLNLIDYMSDVLDKKPGAEESPASSSDSASTLDTNFQSAGVTLETGVRIYSCRVDSVHADTYKVLSGLTRSDSRPPEEQDEMDAENMDGTSATKARKPRARRPGANLVTNTESLNVEKFDLEFAVDPLFHRMSAAFDEGGAKGLILNNLPITSGGAVMFDSCDVYPTRAVRTAPARPGPAFSPNLENSVVIEAVNSFMAPPESGAPPAAICPPFSAFRSESFPGIPMDGVDTVALTTPPPPPPAAMTSHAHGTATTLGDDDHDDHVDLGDDDFADAVDGDMVDFDDMPNAMAQEETLTAILGTGAAGHSSKTMSAQLMSAIGSGSGDEYSFFKTDAIKAWAGPTHWKRPGAALTSSLGNTSGGASTTTTRTKKGPFFVDFSPEAPLIDVETAFAPPSGKATTTYSARVLEKHTMASTTLPDDLHYSLKDLLSLFLKPKWKLVPSKEGDSAGMVMDQAYNYANDNDMENYVPEDDGNDFGFGGDDDDDMGDYSEAIPGSGSGEGVAAGFKDGMALLSAPRQVEKLKIGYVKVAKKVDVKLLKENIWTHLNASVVPGSGKENVKANGLTKDAQEQVTSVLNKGGLDGATASVSEVKDLTQPQRFSELLSTLPVTLNESLKSEVSVPFCFICLLHLANENGLEITSPDTMDDLIIRQPESAVSS